MEATGAYVVMGQTVWVDDDRMELGVKGCGVLDIGGA
jgi:hypothetical protein